MKMWGSGDDGTTGLFGHERVAKDDLRPESYGTIDEATSALGVAKCSDVEARTRELLEEVQQDLYYIMGEIATTDENLAKLPVRVGQVHVDKLDAYCTEIETAISIPNQFVLPGGCMASAQLDLARAMVRRAERVTVTLMRSGTSGNASLLRYLNRLSTLLYLLARYEDDRKGVLLALTKKRKGG
ncbi:MAG TPA: cob(I)yrinic acid a,c-diamide adenosyltransferase [Chloroflexota bacterium]|nr:cob(I)yrinic acid a,c-diamide adenosyltransferase [Chloroflexota bacterium]